MKGKKIIILILSISGIGCGIIFGWHVYGVMESEKQYAILRTEVVSKEELEGSQNKDITRSTNILEYAKEETENPINFQLLQKINPEICAWVQIPGTRIDYPVARHEGEDQSFYLNHNLYGEPEVTGCIYMENINQLDFNAGNTVLYGHNMKNGSMFQNLHLFKDEKFFDENEKVYIYLPGEILEYRIIAAYETDNRHILYAFDFSSPNMICQYLQEVLSIRSMYAHVRHPEDLPSELKILTMSTCVSGRPESRYLIQALLYQREATN